MSNFFVTVVIPVFNAGKFLKEAVRSAINIDEVKEILLVEDGSTDNSLKICNELERKFPKVKVVWHEKHKNKGAGASRNLGIRHAQTDYIAFLDADDIYLPNRFSFEKEMYHHKRFDGIYHASGYFNSDKLMKLENDVSGYKVFSFLMGQGKGTVATNCWTFKKSVFDNYGYFNESLRLHQDTELWLRLARRINIIPGITKEPVSLIREHSNNRITKANKKSKKKLWFIIFKEHFFAMNLRLKDRLYILKVLIALLK